MFNFILFDMYFIVLLIILTLILKISHCVVEGSKKYTKKTARRTVVEIVNKLTKNEDEKTIDENVEKEKSLEGDEIKKKKQTKKINESR